MNPATYFSLLRLEGQLETPALIFDLDAFERRLKWIKETTAGMPISFLFPVKCMPMARVLRLAGRYLDGFDVSNEREAVLAGPKGECWLTSPATTFDTSRPIWKIRRNLIVNLPHAGANIPLSRDLRYSLRLDSSQLVKSSRGFKSRFGASIAKSDLRPAVERLGERFAGFHVHHGTEKNRASDFVALLDSVLSMSHELEIKPSRINLGGGLANLDDAEFVTLVKRLRSRLPKGTRLYLEPGRFLTEKCGYALTRVLDVNSRSRREKICVLDISRVGHLFWARFKLLAAQSGNGATTRTRFYGPTCYEGDFLGALDCETPAKGQPLVLSNVAGYSFAWNRSFNGIEKANTYFLSKGKATRFSE